MPEPPAPPIVYPGLSPPPPPPLPEFAAPAPGTAVLEPPIPALDDPAAPPEPA